jgi:Predicted Zn-dependent protease (DUF2268)
MLMGVFRGTAISLTAVLVCLGFSVASLSLPSSAQEASRSDAQFSNDPNSAQIVTRDIDNFWRAYDLAGPNNAVEVFQEEYINKGSIGLRDFVQSRIDSACELANWVARHPLYYRSIRPSTARVSSFTPQIRQTFRRLKDLYPQAVFPDVYFVIGRMTSGGTTSYNGLLIGTEMYGRMSNTPTSELDDWHKQVLKPVDELPGVVAHELIHFEQKGPDPQTLLGRAIREGSADFIGELISGLSINSELQSYGQNHERELWQEFRAAMNGPDSSNWLYNAGRSKDRPADLGYYVGYKITQSYYQLAQDNKQAIRDILETRDYEQLLRKSNYGEKFGTVQAPR